MSLCKINIKDRNYTSWDLVNAKSLKPMELKICPLNLKLLNQDIFSQGQDIFSQVEIIHSPTRTMKYIPGGRETMVGFVKFIVLLRMIHIDLIFGWLKKLVLKKSRYIEQNKLNRKLNKN